MSLRKQAASLAIMHAFEVLQPLLVLPYAGRVLGAHHFGEYAYAVSIGQLAATIVEYGFHWTAQRAAASARQEPPVLESLFAEVTVTKAMLAVLVTLSGLASTNGLLAVTKPMFLCSMLTAAGGILFPAWLLIGLEYAWQAAFAVVVARTIALVCFFVLVTSSAQVELAVAIQSAVPFVSGAVSLPFVARVGFSGFKSVTPARIGMQLRNGWRGFLFSFVERVSITLPIPLVEHFAGYAAAGQYSVAEKFVSATRPFFRVVSETFLPRIAYYARYDQEAGLRLICVSLSTLVVGVSLSLGLFFVAPYLVVTFFGAEFSGATHIVRLMSVIPLVVNANICTSNLYMFNFGHERAWSFLTVSGLVVFLAVAYLLLPIWSDGAGAVAVAVIAKEVVVLVVSAGYFLAFFSTVSRHSRAGGGVSLSNVTVGSTLLALVRAVRLRHDQLRS